MDAGVRWAITPGLKLVAGGFEVEKPYFTTD
jgi:iron complex outermembrane receptor protein